MAEEQTGQERTEEPTERRLQESRKKGQVPRSKELNVMLSLLFAGGGLWVLGGPLVERMFAISKLGFSVDREIMFNAELLPMHFMRLVSESLLAIAPFLAVTVVAALAGPIVMGGWSFSLQSMAFKLEKLDPIKGFGRLFSAKSLVELIKALLKFSVLLAVTYALIMFFEREILSLTIFTPGEAALRVSNMLLVTLLVLSGTMLLIVMFDVPFELWNHNRQLKMTRQEVRDEMKESEGRPEVKQRIRQMQQEVSQRRMMEDIPNADVVITNPTHFAVALSYANQSSAPRVVARGQDLMALQIRRIAQEHDVPIYEEPPLARALYANTEIGEEIPEALYLAVARVLAYLFQLRRSRPTEYVPRPSSIKLPEEFSAFEESPETIFDAAAASSNNEDVTHGKH